jgi:hypothetical protein
VLQICLSCFETIGHYTGDFSGSRQRFETVCSRCFPI